MNSVRCAVPTQHTLHLVGTGACISDIHAPEAALRLLLVDYRK
jgi:hypothetical protein